jgi:hypothetical protein
MQVAVVDASCCGALVVQGVESVWDGYEVSLKKPGD